MRTISTLFLTALFLIPGFLSAQVANDDCANAQSLGTLSTPNGCQGGGPSAGQGSPSSWNLTNINSQTENPYSTLTNCQQPAGQNMASPATDVWYSFVATGNELDLSITGGISNPNVAIYSGACGSLVGRGCAIGSGGSLNVTFDQMFPGTTYYIQISGGTPADQGNFTLTLQNNNSCDDCLQQSSLTVNPLPMNGTYLGGQTVTFCFTVSDWEQQNTNWFHGVEIDFGAGWNTGSITNIVPAASCAGGGTWGWYNSVTSSATGNTFGPGFFYELSGNPNDPGDNFGDNCGTGGTSVGVGNWTFCFDITTNPCPPGTQGQDLTISFNTLGDGESGSWSNLACTLDPDYIFSANLSCCPPPISVVTNVTCPGGSDGAVTSTAQGTGPWNYQWVTSPGGTVLQTDNNLNGASTITGLPSGTYIVNVLDQNDGCVTADTVTITEPPAITYNVNITPPSCNGGSNGQITVTGAAGGNGGAYTYSVDGGPFGPGPFTGLSAGNHTVIVHDNQGCADTTTVNMTQPTPVVANATPSNVSCNGGTDGSISASGSGGAGGYTFSLDGGPFGGSGNFTGLGAGNHTVIVHDQNGCPDTVTVTINEPTAVVLNATPSDVSCFGGTDGSISASASGGAGGYTFNVDGGPFGGSGNFTGLGAGNHTVIVNDQNGCADTVTVTINQPTAVVLNATPTAVSCNGANDGSISASASGGAGGYTFNIDGGAFGGSGNFTGLSGGNHTIIVQDQNGCADTLVVNVNEPTAVVLNLTPTNVSCNGASDGSISASASGGAGGYTYNIDGGAFGGSGNFTGLGAGNHTVIVQDQNGCADTATVNLTEPPAITTSMSSSPASCGATDGSATVTPGGGAGGFTYNWSTNPVQTTQTATNIGGGTYYVTVTDQNNCEAYDTVVVSQSGAPTAFIVNVWNVSCNGANDGQAQAFASGGSPGYTYQWSTVPAQNTQTATNLAPGSYTVTVSDLNGCSDVATVIINEPGPITTATGVQNVSCNGSADGCASISASGGNGAFSYLWSTGATTDTICNLGPGTYYVTVTDTSTTGNLTYNMFYDDFEGSNAWNLNVSTGTNGADNNFWTISDNEGGMPAGMCGTANNGDNTLHITSVFCPTCGAAYDAGGLCGVLFCPETNVRAESPAFATTGCNNPILEFEYIANGNPPNDAFSVWYDAGGGWTLLQNNVTSPTCVSGQGQWTTFSMPLPPAAVNNPNVQIAFNWTNNDDGVGSDPSVAINNVRVTCAATQLVSYCTAIDTVVVTEPPVLGANFTTIDVACFGDATGCIEVTATGGVGNYGYTWSNGMSGDSICGLIAGTYTVTITDTTAVSGGGGQIQQIYYNDFDGAQTWTLNVPTGANGANPNFWVVNDNEGGVAPNGCGVANNGDATLHITSQFCPACGAAYDAGGLCGILFCPETNARAESPAISSVGYTNLTLSFDFISNGSGLLDNASVWYNDGTGWNQLTASIKSPVCGGGQGQWTAYSAALPASCAGIPNLQVAVNWTNNDDGVGTDPSVAINNVEITGLSSAGGVNNVICTYVDSITINEPAELVVSTQGTNPNCNGGSDGSATASSTGGTGQVTFTWLTNPVQIGATATGLGAGTYTVVGQDANGCTDTTTVTLSNPVAITTAMAQTNATCGLPNGDATVTPAGGGGTYTYSWSTNPVQTTATASNLAAGTYYVTVFDQFNCTAVDSVTITTTTLPDVNITNVTNVSCNGGNDGEATAVGSGGTPGYSFEWSNGQQVATATNLSAGWAYVTVTDAVGCTDVDSVLITQPTAITLTMSSTEVGCNVTSPNGTTTVQATGGTGGYTYVWSTLPPQTGQQATGLDVGSYTVTVTDANGCTATGTVQVTEQLPPVITAGADVDFCEGEGGALITVTGNGGTSPYYYQWWCNNPAFCGLDSINDNDPIANPTATTTYYVQITDANGCVSAIDSVVVTVNPKPHVDAGEDIIICGDSAPCVTLSPTITGGIGPFTYLWSPSTGLSDPTIPNPCARPDTTTIYQLVVTDLSTGCTSEVNTLDTLSTITVFVNPVPVADAGPDRDICLGDTVMLTGVGYAAGPLYDYEWTPGGSLSDSSIANPLAFPALTTDYTLVVWSNGCPSYADTVTVNVHQIPTLFAGFPVEICLGETGMLDAETDVDPATWNWWPSTGAVSGTDVEDFMASPDTTTQYFVEVVSEWGCRNIDSSWIYVKPTPFAEAGPNLSLCGGDTLQLQGGYYYTTTDTAPNPSQVYLSWTPGADLSDTTVAQPFAWPGVSTWYYLTATYNTCSTTDSMLVSVIPEMFAGATADTTNSCQGDSVQLHATGGLGGSDYTWYPSTGLSDPNSSDPFAAPDSTTTYYVLINEGGCTDTASVTLDILPTPIAADLSSLTEGCAPFTVNFLQTASGGDYYIWDFGDGTSVSNESNPSHVYEEPGTYNVTLTAVSAGGCKDQVSDIVVTVGEGPLAEFNSDPAYPAELSLPNTTVQFFDVSTNATYFFWNFGDGNQSEEEHPTHTYTEPGTYMVILTVENLAGCRDTVVHGPYVIIAPDLFIPNVFTPNDDGQNDEFLVNYTGSQPFFMKIYDRWGELLHQTANKNDGWSGLTGKGDPAPEGVYFYHVTVGDKEYVGEVTLLR